MPFLYRIVEKYNFYTINIKQYIYLYYYKTTFNY